MKEKKRKKRNGDTKGQGEIRSIQSISKKLWESASKNWYALDLRSNITKKHGTQRDKRQNEFDQMARKNNRKLQQEIPKLRNSSKTRYFENSVFRYDF